jgi:hypothetical protein
MSHSHFHSNIISYIFKTHSGKESYSRNSGMCFKNIADNIGMKMTVRHSRKPALETLVYFVHHFNDNRNRLININERIQNR